MYTILNGKRSNRGQQQHRFKGEGEGSSRRVKGWPRLKSAIAGETKLIFNKQWGGSGHAYCKDARQLKESTHPRSQEVGMASRSDFVATVAIQMITKLT